jgi:predicted Zn-ribbon and HTH transcriptional regulator
VARPPRDPALPPERRETIRQAILRALDQGPATSRDLSRLVGIPEDEVAHHLEHLQRSLAKSERKLVVTPAECHVCGYVFERRRRLKKPSSCPECRSQRIHPPHYALERPAGGDVTG